MIFSQNVIKSTEEKFNNLLAKAGTKQQEIIGKQVLKEIPLVAESAVEKVTWGQMFLRLMKKMCMK